MCYLHWSSRRSYIDVGHNVDTFTIANFVLTLWESNLWCSRLLTSSTARCNVDHELLSIFTVGVSHDHSIGTSRIRCGTIENETVSFNGEQRWDRLVALIGEFFPGHVNGILRLEQARTCLQRSKPDDSIWLTATVYWTIMRWPSFKLIVSGRMDTRGGPPVGKRRHVRFLHSTVQSRSGEWRRQERDNTDQENLSD